MNIDKLNNLVAVLSAGVEKIHGDAMSGADKKTVVTNLIVDAAAIGMVVDPKDAKLIETSANIVSLAIDAIVRAFNVIGFFKRKKPAENTLPVPAQYPASSLHDKVPA